MIPSIINKFQIEAMEALQSELTLLKNYVNTLEHQNQARNKEKNTLFSEIDRLTQQNDCLNDLLSKSKIKTNNGNIQETQALKKQNSSLSIQIKNLKASIASLTSQNTSLKTRANNQNLSQFSLEIENLKKKLSQLTSENSSKDWEIRRVKEQKESLMIQISTLKSQGIKRESDLNKPIVQIQRLQKQVAKLQRQNKQLKQGSKSSSEVSNLLSTKLNLEATIRQLTSRVQWMEATNKSLEREKRDCQNRVTELQKQLYEAKGRLTQLRFNEDSYKNIESNLKIKDKQMEALEHMIATLKENKKYLQQALKEKEEIIVNLQSQVFTFRSSAHDLSDMERELNEIKSYKNKYQHQIKDLTRNNQQLTMQIITLKNQISALASQLYLNKQEKQKLLREQTTYLQHQRLHQQTLKSRIRDSSEVMMYRSISPPRDLIRPTANDQDLRIVVEQLRAQVQQLKKVPLSQSELYPQNNDAYRNVGHRNQWSNMAAKDKSLIRDNTKKSHSRVIIEKDKHMNNRQKWQSLQNKINALRSENESLKKSLFD